MNQQLEALIELHVLRREKACTSDGCGGVMHPRIRTDTNMRTGEKKDTVQFVCGRCKYRRSGLKELETYMPDSLHLEEVVEILRVYWPLGNINTRAAADAINARRIVNTGHVS